ncbi:MAG: hypothetical protein RBR19_15505 [Sedimentisphaerales bacterium]|nr:hypothetical protein [Sedimentisphaerales bacterium]
MLLRNCPGSMVSVREYPVAATNGDTPMTTARFAESTRTAVAAYVLLTCCSLWADQGTPGEVSYEVCDIAPFGFRVSNTDAGWHGIRWAEPRKIRQLIVQFEEPRNLPDPSQVKVQYWHRTWDGKADPVQAERGAGGVGWDAMDDWTNGQWIDGETSVRADNGVWTFTFLPITSEEIAGVQGSGVAYRKTLWVRLVFDRSVPKIRNWQVITESAYHLLSVRIHFGKPVSPAAKTTGPETGSLEVYNGRLLNVRPVADEPVKITPDFKWSLPADANATIEADLLVARDPADDRYDRTIVTVRSSHRPFSFAADEIARGDRILVDDLGILVTQAQDTVTLAGYREALRTGFRGRTVYDRVADAPEQTLSQAWADMPLKRPLWFVHGLPGDRNTMRQHPNGDIDVTAVSRWFALQRSARDSDRKQWRGDMLSISFGMPDETRRGGRRLEEGYLPLLHTWWQDGSVYYEQNTLMDTLDADLNDIDLDDPTVLLMQVRMVNTSSSDPAPVRLRLASHAPGEGRLTVRHGQALAQTDQGPRLRFLVTGGERGIFSAEGNATAWTANLQPGEVMTLHFCIPSVTLTDAEEIETLQQRDFESDARRICSFWRELTARATQIETPEPWINDFYKAHLRHLLVNCFKELDSDLLHAHVGTFYYGVYPNESVMMISDLDRRGLHEQAQHNLDAFLHYQGTVSMPGNFRSREGQFYGAGGHETGGYNKSHGYVMWNMAQHWWLTRDRAWMEQAAPKLVQACDWVVKERQATMTISEDGTKPLEYGWLPSGSLEDVTDYWYWIATNSATVWGFQALADALADSGHPEGARLQKEAQAYSDDFMSGITESRIRCPVVRLRDATYVPKIPSRVYERGRAHGWLRETLEGALFLPAYGLLSPDAPETEWILKDYEDNLYVSERYGYAIPAFDDFWFSRGGFSMQANLLDGPLPYLCRDDIKHFVRAYFNGFASAFYPEIRMCNEHSLPELGYPRGDHFKSSDEAQSTYWLRLMFVNEVDSGLYLGQAIPRYWLSHGNKISITNAPSKFGVLSVRMESASAEGRIKAIVDPPRRNPPERIFLRLRHPQGNRIKEVTVNGQPYRYFDADREWIVLPGNLNDRQEVIAIY